MGNQTSNELHEYAQLQMPAVSATAEVTYILQTIGPGPSITGPPPRQPSIGKLPKDVVLKVFTDCCELWVGGTEESKHPIDRWPMCNIVSWGCNTSAVRFIVLSDELVPADASNSPATIVRTRATYDFETTLGAQIVKCMKDITSPLAAELRKHMKHKTFAATQPGGVACEVLPTTPPGKVKRTFESNSIQREDKVIEAQEPTPAQLRAERFPKQSNTTAAVPAPSLIERSEPLPPDVAELNTFQRSYSTLLSAEAGLPIDTLRLALSQEGREPSAKGQVLSAAQRIHASRQNKAENAVTARDVTIDFVQPVFKRSYSALCADEAGVPIDVMREVLTKDGRDESAKPQVLSAAQRIWNSRAMTDNASEGGKPEDLIMPKRRNICPAA